MKRTPPLLAVLAVAVQLAGIGLCVWAMSWHAPPLAESEADVIQPDTKNTGPLRAPSESPSARQQAVHAWTAPAVASPHGFGLEREASAAQPPLRPRMTAIPLDRPDPAPAPNLVAPPPPSGSTPAYILELAERTTQIVRGFADGGWLTFGFYADGNIRMVDGEGARFEGRAVSARADMKEAGGSRSFSLQIGVASDGRLQAVFAGGSYDGQTLVLEQIIERPVA
ncbi:MAG: hypothetical protein NVSMB64_17640 [Candidatus Velthaea sp.]